MNTCKTKTFFYLISIFSLFLLLSISKNESNEIPIEQWALYNNGQTIQDQKGKKGVDLNVEYIWPITKGDKNTIVGILDTGINSDLTYVSNNILNEGINFINNSTDIYNKYTADYHGTMIASIIGGKHHSGNPVWGIAPEVSILPLKFMERRDGNINEAVRAINYAASKEVDIINCSWDTELYNEKLYNVIKQNDDILFITSAGKTGESIENSPVYPASFDLDNVISVGAINNNGIKTELTGYGNTNTIYGPGGDILVLDPDGSSTYVDGSSFATAYISGISALIKSKYPNINAIELANLIKNQISEDINILDTKDLFVSAERLNLEHGGNLIEENND